MARPNRFVNEEKKFVPGCDARPEEIFDFPYLVDDETIKFISTHGRIMFIVRGPPGTGKNTLSSMISTKYPFAVTCSADKYFSQAFVSKNRNKNTLTKSHEFCHSRVREECEKGTHVITVQNTHIKKFEMQEYLDFAAEYDYTVIMAITLRRFSVSPMILAQTNKKGLTEDYLRRRLRQWQEVYPKYTGWFLCPDDSTFILQEAKYSLEAALKNKEFRNHFSKDELFGRYEIKARLFCIATYLKSNAFENLKTLYNSDTVQDVYGKCFPITVQGFVVTKSSILAVVAISEDMKPLVVRPDAKSNVIDDISSVFGALNTHYIDENKTGNTFTKEFQSLGNTAKLTDWMDEEVINIKYLSLIVLAVTGNDIQPIESVEEYALNLFTDIIDSEGCIKESQFAKLDDGIQVAKLQGDNWLIKSIQKVQLNSIFTGFYV